MEDTITAGLPQSARELLHRSNHDGSLANCNIDKKGDNGNSNGGASSCSGADGNNNNNANKRSAGLTFANQNQLPRLPVPTLEETLERFPRVLAPLQDEYEQQETARVVKEFLDGDGPILQRALVEYEEAGFHQGRLGSYVEEFWNDAYLSPDASLVMNLNPFFVLEEGPDPKIANDQLRRAANLCFASLKFASAVKKETLAPDVFKGRALCMDQFKVMFGSSRQPAVHNGQNQCDDVHVYRDSSHVVVLVKNQFYYFSALWPETADLAVDEADILDILGAIQSHATANTDEETASTTAIGVFSSLPRSQWAVIRQELCQNQLNKTSLHVIDSALFVLVLDDYIPPDVHSAAANMLHGTNKLAGDDDKNDSGDPDKTGILQVGSCLNRWYDKLQIIVCKDGTAGCNFEHAVIDGHTALRFVSDVFAETVIGFAESVVDLIHGRGRIPHVVDATVNRAAGALGSSGAPTLDVFPKKLLFELSEPILQRIRFAETALCDDLNANDTCVLEFKDYGKMLIVGNSMSPDSFVQMSILLAYYKLYGKVVCMYEPVLTKSFYHGRTEAMRTVTNQAKELCEVWCNPSSSAEDKLNSLRLATKEHSRLVRDAAGGKGVDRHLFSLMRMSDKLGSNGSKLPPFFRSAAWKTLNHTVLSTSNCGNPSLRLFGFGPVVPDGFGVGYIIKDYGLSYSVCSKHRQTMRYIRSLRSTLEEIQKLLQPLSTISVKKHRPSLREIRASSSSTNLSLKNQMTFADIWGESSGSGSGDNDGSKQWAFKAFPQVKAHDNSVQMLSVSNFQEAVDLDREGADRTSLS